MHNIPLNQVKNNFSDNWLIFQDGPYHLQRLQYRFIISFTEIKTINSWLYFFCWFKWIFCPPPHSVKKYWHILLNIFFLKFITRTELVHYVAKINFKILICFSELSNLEYTFACVWDVCRVHLKLCSLSLYAFVPRLRRKFSISERRKHRKETFEVQELTPTC